MQTTLVLHNQTLLDISLQEMGTAECLFELALKNNLSITDSLNIGKVINIPTSNTNNVDVIKYFKRREYLITTELKVNSTDVSFLDYLLPQTLPHI